MERYKTSGGGISRLLSSAPSLHRRLPTPFPHLATARHAPPHFPHLLAPNTTICIYTCPFSTPRKSPHHVRVPPRAIRSTLPMFIVLSACSW